MNHAITSAHQILSPLVIGSWKWGRWGANLPTDEIKNVIDVCIDLGITSFDHADIYGHYTDEAAFGKALGKANSIRSKIQIVTKCGIMLVCPERPFYSIKHYDASRQHIIQSVENSLTAFHTDYMDILLIHRHDWLMDINEVAEAFASLKKAGKVLYFGVSNFTTTQFEMLDSVTPLVTNQIEVSLLHREYFFNGVLDQAQKLNRAPMAWSPLGSGRYTSLEDPEAVRVQNVAQPIMEKYNATLDQIYINWILMHPSNIFPVIGTSKIDRIKSAVKALSFKLTREEWYALWVAAEGNEVP